MADDDNDKANVPDFLKLKEVPVDYVQQIELIY